MTIWNVPQGLEVGETAGPVSTLADSSGWASSHTLVPSTEAAHALFCLISESAASWGCTILPNVFFMVLLTLLGLNMSFILFWATSLALLVRLV